VVIVAHSVHLIHSPRRQHWSPHKKWAATDHHTPQFETFGTVRPRCPSWTRWRSLTCIQTRDGQEATVIRRGSNHHHL